MTRTWSPELIGWPGKKRNRLLDGCVRPRARPQRVALARPAWRATRWGIAVLPRGPDTVIPPRPQSPRACIAEVTRGASTCVGERSTCRDPRVQAMVGEARLSAFDQPGRRRVGPRERGMSCSARCRPDPRVRFDDRRNGHPGQRCPADPQDLRQAPRLAAAPAPCARSVSWSLSVASLTLQRSRSRRRLCRPTVQCVAGYAVAAGGVGVAVSVWRRTAAQAIQAPLTAIRTAPIGWVGRLAPVVAMPRAAPKT